MTLRLGRLPHSQQRVAAAPSLATHTFAAIAPAVRVDRSTVPYHPRMFDNDRYGDCSAANTANYMTGFALLNGAPPVIADDAPLKFFAGCVGLAVDDPALEASDGVVILTMLDHQWRNGFDVGPQTLYAEYGTVPLERAALANLINRLGGGGFGFDLYAGDMTMPAIWDTDYDRGDFVGGHWVHGWDYTGLGDTDTVRFATWGGFQAATWRWVQARVQEAHGMIWRQLMRPDGLTWSGVDYDRLRVECEAT